MFLGGAHYTEFVDQFLQIFTKTLGDWRRWLKTARYLYAIGLEKTQAFLRFRAYTPRRLRVRCKVLLESARFMAKSCFVFWYMSGLTVEAVWISHHRVLRTSN